jgi:hypothetical protein
MGMSRRDEGLDRPLDLDGFLAEVGGGSWVKIRPQAPENLADKHVEATIA